jgi:signal transduction histidine kinase
MNTDSAIRAERLAAAWQQIPLAVSVTAVNAVLVAAVAPASLRGGWILVWLALVLGVGAARLALWHAWRRRPHPDLRPWTIASVVGAACAGLLWGGGMLWLPPDVQAFHLFWIFLIGGMCAGAATLHATHLPTALGFILPACLPVALRLLLMAPGWHQSAAVMVAIFVAALVVTTYRSSRYFGQTLYLRFDLAERTRELAATNRKLRQEMAEREATAARLHHAQKMEAIGQLTGGLSHDFNNLLSVVLGSLDLLGRRLPPDDPTAARLLANAIQSAERGAGLIQRLLAFGRQQTLRPDVVDVPTLVRGLLPLLQSSTGPAVKVGLHVPDHLPPVQVDANQLELALLNLAVNARDAMPGGGALTITVRAERLASPEPDGLAAGDYVVLSLADTGDGMDPATLTRAMEPFFTTKPPGKGTGLGLSMVHGFAAQSGGQLRLHSRAGAGTVAEIWLPRTDPERPLTAAGGRPRRTVLVLDDDPMMLASTAAMLRQIGDVPVEAASPQQALADLERTAVDVAVVDAALAPALRAVRPDLAMLLTVAPAEAAADPAQPCLRTPFDMPALAAALGELEPRRSGGSAPDDQAEPR